MKKETSVLSAQPFLTLVICFLLFIISLSPFLLEDFSPSEIYTQAPSYNLYFGDLHAHSSLSADAHPLGKATYKDFYPYGRNTMGLDFCTMTDHFDVKGQTMTAQQWSLVQQEAAKNYEPGKFTTFTAFEWTNMSTGHKNVYFPGTNVPSLPWSAQDPNYNTPDKLWQAAASYGALTNPHHPQGYPAATSWSYFNETYQRLVEIYSKWGNAEYDGAQPEAYTKAGNHSVQEALSLGQKLGFVGGTDTHSSLCGYLEPNEGAKLWGYPQILKYRGGLTGVWAKENTREGLWEAMQERRTFATTGEKIRFWYTVNGAPMGSEITLQGDPVITIDINATRPIKVIRILRDNQEIYLEERFTGKTTASFTYTDTTLTNGNHYYYVRMGQDDANGDGYPEQAWASPVWVTKTGNVNPSPTPEPTPTPSPSPTPGPSPEARYEYYNTGRNGYGSFYGTSWVGQTFTPSTTHTVTKIKQEMCKIGAPAPLVCGIRKTSGGKPIGGDLTLGTIDSTKVSSCHTFSWIEIDLPDFGPILAGNQYATVCRCPSCNSNNRYIQGVDITSPTYTRGTAVGSSNGGASWIIYSGADSMFEEWSYPRGLYHTDFGEYGV